VQKKDPLYALNKEQQVQAIVMHLYN
jgi:hypothetical protein